jgi:hypothetical protein
MIHIFNSAYRDSDVRKIPLDEVNIVTQNISVYGKPYILFEHKDYPLGALQAIYNGEHWSCDLD